MSDKSVVEALLNGSFASLATEDERDEMAATGRSLLEIREQSG